MTTDTVYTDPVIYYAHCMSWYNTPAEALDIEALSAYGRVINPNTPEFESRVKRAKRYGEPVMQIFADYIRDYVDIVAFRPLYDGRIGAGVFREVMEGAIWGKGIWRLEDRSGGVSVNQYLPLHAIDFSQVMTVCDTRAAVATRLL